MALTLSDDWTEQLGTKKLKQVTVTHDGSTSGFTALSVGLNYITGFQINPVISGVAATSLIVGNLKGSIQAENVGLDWVFDPLPSAGDKSIVWLVGW